MRLGKKQKRVIEVCKEKNGATVTDLKGIFASDGTIKYALKTLVGHGLLKENPEGKYEAVEQAEKSED